MSQHPIIAVALLLALTVAPSSSQARTWSSASGTFKVEGELVEARPDGTLLLKDQDGKMVEVQLDLLSQADQDFVRQQAPPSQPENTFGIKSSDTPSEEVPRRPLPNTKELAEKIGELLTLLKSDFEKARTAAADRQALLDKLTQLANESLPMDPAGAFATTSLAAEVAADGGDLTEALSRLTWLEERFQITDARARKVKLAGRLKVASLTPAEAAAVTVELLSILEELEDAADYEGAMELGQLTLRVARRANDPKLLTRVFAHGRNLKEHKEYYEGAAASLITLKTVPQDAAASLMLGKFLCLVRGKWEQGLPLLVVGGDTELAPIAKRDLHPPNSAAEQAGVADEWWKLSETPKYNDHAEELMRRAAFWYRLALPQLTAVAKLRAEKRIESAPAERLARDTLQANVPKNKAAGEPKNGGAAGWFVVFRSGDPSVWDSDSKEANRYAIPLDKVSEEIKFLKLKRTDSNAAIIIPMTKGQLRTQFENETSGWIGTKRFEWKAYHLGVFNKQWNINGAQTRGKIAVVHFGPGRDGAGWGFGHKVHVDDKQYFSWAGQEINPTIFEIAVTARALSKADEKLLLK